MRRVIEQSGKIALLFLVAGALALALKPARVFAAEPAENVDVLPSGSPDALPQPYDAGLWTGFLFAPEQYINAEPEQYPGGGTYVAWEWPETPEPINTEPAPETAPWEWADFPIVQAGYTPGMSSNADANVRAFLATIRAVEARDNYGALVGGGSTNDFRDHPANLGWAGIRLANGLRATSAGAYQITQTTWNTWIQPRLRLPDFSPASQDAAGLEILRAKRGSRAFQAVQEGRFFDALALYRLEWEAFDKMLKRTYGITLEQAQAIYEAAGGTVTGTTV